MNIVCILLAIAPLLIASIDIAPFDKLIHIIQFFSGISKSYDWKCSAAAKNLFHVPDETRQKTRGLLFKLTEQEQKKDPVKVLKLFEAAITDGFKIEKKVGCHWDHEKIICVFGNKSCGS